MAGKWTVAPGGFIFTARQSIRVQAYNGVREESYVNWKKKSTNSRYSIYLCFLALAGFKENAWMRPLLWLMREKLPPRKPELFILYCVANLKDSLFFSVCSVSGTRADSKEVAPFIGADHVRLTGYRSS